MPHRGQFPGQGILLPSILKVQRFQNLVEPNAPSPPTGTETEALRGRMRARGCTMHRRGVGTRIKLPHHPNQHFSWLPGHLRMIPKDKGQPRTPTLGHLMQNVPDQRRGGLCALVGTPQSQTDRTLQKKLAPGNIFRAGTLVWQPGLERGERKGPRLLVLLLWGALGELQYITVHRGTLCIHVHTHVYCVSSAVYMWECVSMQVCARAHLNVQMCAVCVHAGTHACVHSLRGGARAQVPVCAHSSCRCRF